ncbi:hypothetical protein G7B40_040275 [Aetokthonos hydrillicola Thurmond2011]|jgi:hypothetical protein|uniref:Uncharacterized protein n=1 Tax=Aetokthonos hydrillicola Thurmond2011 TaxID=2712845 RepID=A0AAP5IGM7_9CYAN|nr:hypothetical protein [Aetokthonos hydrillicola]MBO3459966.1 hypothetical protein [Aetokthonos hydrillicola CCALA 1050]MBW4584085.1 hypothetical protein [Aetokthonos hydrillicola CCALA 1050]MDR9900727.1 hypothetical protein [Aetokthonos hydrillicola Thurmond2011]
MPTLEALKRRHTEHQRYCDYWELLTAIVEGGDSMTDDTKRKLLPNPDGRPEAVMKERVRLATYCNKIAPILSRFNSELFKNPATPTGSDDPFWSDDFFKNGALLDGDDDGRASFNTFLMQAMMMALMTGKAIAQIDTKRANGAVSKAQQQESGELNPYVILHPRSALWDWDSGRDGFNFVKLHQFRLVRSGWEATPIPEHVFTIYYRENGAIFTSKYVVRKIERDSKPPLPEPFISHCTERDISIQAIIEGAPIFNVGGKFEFPIVTLTLPKALWMAAQLFDCQKSYFNQTAALEYALYSNNYAMPVITGVDDDDDDPLQNRKMGDGYYLTLKTNQSITSFERSGASIQTAIGYRAEVKRDIYDVLQQIAMSAADGASIIARSGESKSEDRRPEEILLERYGQIVKEFIVQVLKPSAIARGEIVDWAVTGYDEFLGFSITDLLTDMQGIATAAIPSPTFKKEIQKHFVKRAARVYDLDQNAVVRSLSEIDVS